jgi:hypothetical protein
MSKKFEKLESPLAPLLAMAKNGKPIQDALKDFI